MTIGKEVRLKSGYIIKGKKLSKTAREILLKFIVPMTLKVKAESGSEASQRKVKGTLHWVNQETAQQAKVNLYDRLFNVENPDQNKDQEFTDFINTDSFKQVTAQVEPSLVNLNPGTNIQFQRLGYFVVDDDSTKNKLVFNKTVGLRDTWSKKK